MKSIEATVEKHIKRPFTEQELRALAKRVLQEGERVRRAKRDWVAFVVDELKLTKVQKENLAKLPRDIVQLLQQSFNEALDGGGDIDLDIAFGSAAKADSERGSAEPSGRLVIEKSKSEAGPRITIPVLHCTFDANCDNWSCNVGPAR